MKDLLLSRQPSTEMEPLFSTTKMYVYHNCYLYLFIQFYSLLMYFPFARGDDLISCLAMLKQTVSDPCTSGENQFQPASSESRTV